MTLRIRPDGRNRIVLTREMRREAGIEAEAVLEVIVQPGMILISPVAFSKGKIVKKGKLKVFRGEVPDVDLPEAVHQARHYIR